ncbi:MAG: transporter substrate-binding domain-containing protein [Verrucomicrobiales bacterium]
MTVRRDFLGLLLGAALPMLLSGCGDGDSGAGGGKPLVVGMELAYPPFEMRGPDNKPDGISVAMARDLAAYLERPLRIEDIQWDGIIPALKSGRIDLIISSMTRTEERAEAIDFSDGYVTNGLCMLVARDSDIQGIGDLVAANGTAAVKLATTGHLYAREHLPQVQLTVLDDATTCALEVAQGKVDAFIYDQVSIYQYWRKHEKMTRPILDPIREETWAIGMRKGEEELRVEVNAFLEDYRSAGKFDLLAERFMAQERKAFKAFGVEFIFH